MLHDLFMGVIWIGSWEFGRWLTRQLLYKSRMVKLPRGHFTVSARRGSAVDVDALARDLWPKGDAGNGD